MDNSTPIPQHGTTAVHATYVELSRRTTDLLDCYLRDLDPTWTGALVLQRTTVHTIVALLDQQQHRIATREAAAVIAVLRGALEREVAV